MQIYVMTDLSMMKKFSAKKNLKKGGKFEVI